MEDEHLIWHDHEIHEQYPALPPQTRLTMCAIYDGHGGSCTVKFVRQRLHGNIASCMADILDKKAPGQAIESKKRARLLNKTEVVKAAILQGFRKTESEVEQEGTKHGWKDGCCAVLLVIINNIVYVANLGDSEAILCRQNGSNSGGALAELSFKSPISTFAADAIKSAPGVDAKGLTKAHNCRQVSEKERILKAGGKIVNGRVNGIMEVSRSFGDLALKSFGVSAEPDLGVLFKLTERDEFVILGCDGLWERYNKDMAGKGSTVDTHAACTVALRTTTRSQVRPREEYCTPDIPGTSRTTYSGLHLRRAALEPEEDMLRHCRRCHQCQGRAGQHKRASRARCISGRACSQLICAQIDVGARCEDPRPGMPTACNRQWDSSNCHDSSARARGALDTRRLGLPASAIRRRAPARGALRSAFA
jgi:serine/threonine protein phosphatase PrpC